MIIPPLLFVLLLLLAFLAGIVATMAAVTWVEGRDYHRRNRG